MPRANKHTSESSRPKNQLGHNKRFILGSKIKNIKVSVASKASAKQRLYDFKTIPKPLGIVRARIEVIYPSEVAAYMRPQIQPAAVPTKQSRTPKARLKVSTKYLHKLVSQQENSRSSQPEQPRSEAIFFNEGQQTESLNRNGVSTNVGSLESL